MGDKTSITEMKTSHLLPLIFYWQYDYKNTCSLNPGLPLYNFASTVMSYGGKGLKNKLNGHRIELTVEKILTRFAIDDKGHIIWVIFVFGWDELSVRPEDKEMIGSYKVFNKDNAEAKNGIIDISNSDKGITLGMFQSIKKKTWQYLDQYDLNITIMSKLIVDKLMKKL